MTRDLHDQQFLTAALSTLAPLLTHLNIHVDPQTLTFTGPDGHTIQGRVDFHVGSSDGEHNLLLGRSWLAARSQYPGEFQDDEGVGPMDINLTPLSALLGGRTAEQALDIHVHGGMHVRVGDRDFPARTTASGILSVRLSGEWRVLRSQDKTELPTLLALLDARSAWSTVKAGRHVAFRSAREVVLHGSVYTLSDARTLGAFLS